MVDRAGQARPERTWRTRRLVQPMARGPPGSSIPGGGPASRGPRLHVAAGPVVGRGSSLVSGRSPPGVGSSGRWLVGAVRGRGPGARCRSSGIPARRRSAPRSDVGSSGASRSRISVGVPADGDVVITAPRSIVGSGSDRVQPVDDSGRHALQSATGRDPRVTVARPGDRPEPSWVRPTCGPTRGPADRISTVTARAPGLRDVRRAPRRRSRGRPRRPRTRTRPRERDHGPRAHRTSHGGDVHGRDRGHRTRHASRLGW